MRYYNYESVPRNINEALQEYFPENTWGCSVHKDTKGNVDIVEICRVTQHNPRCASWEHYAQIIHLDGVWELSEMFIEIDEKFCKKYGEQYRKWVGTEQTAVYIYGMFYSFKRAVKSLKNFGTSINGRKPKNIYV